MKDKIIDGDVLWGTVGSPEWKWNVTRVEYPGGKSKGFPFETSEGETLGLICNTMLSVADSSELWKELGCKEWELLAVFEWYV